MDGRYSLARYSVGEAGRNIQSALHCVGTLNAVAGAAVSVKGSILCTASLRGSLQGTVAIMSTLPAGGALAASVRMSANVIAEMRGAGVLGADVRAEKNIGGSIAAQNSLDGNVWASKSIPAALSIQGRSFGHAVGVKNIYTSLSAASVLTALTEAISQTTERAVFQLTIPPGGELRIDSELYTVLLNGQNALHTQSGEWIQISRELLRVTIESASGGGLEGQLIYTERYL